MAQRLLFVYGTLRRGSGHEMFDVLMRTAAFVDRAVLCGKLYRVADYPGAVASDDPGDVVHGEAYRLMSAETLTRLDRYEGYAPGDSGAAYVRALRSITLAHGGRVRAWVYLYNRTTAGLERIASGDFLAP